MENFVLKMLNMSITAGWLVLALLLIRPLLNKVPKVIRCVLWGLVGVRLICPFSIESVLSMIPSVETVPDNILNTAEPAFDTGINSLNTIINPLVSEQLANETYAPLPTVWFKFYFFVIIWSLGVLGMAIYALVSYLRLSGKVRVSLPLQGGTYLCDDIASPFILGIFRPRIYLPSSMSEEQRTYVIAHEMEHLNRKDHWWKPIGYLLLTFYWFHPLIWIAYIFLCRDIELACDEKVIKKMDGGDKKAYSEVLLSCSMPHHRITACPLAFGEVGVKNRIKSILNYKKPALWLVLVVVILCVAVMVFFMTDPVTENPLPDYDSGSSLPGLQLELTEANLNSKTPSLKVNWKNNTDQAIGFGSSFTLQYKNGGGEWEDCDLLEERVFHLIGLGVQAGEEFERSYSLLCYDLSRPGTYRITATCTVNTDEISAEYTAWLDFWLAKGIKPICYEPKDTIYSNGSFSYVGDAAYAPYYRSVNGILSTRPRGDEGWTNLGAMGLTKLDRENFDVLFTSDHTWYYRSARSLRKDNARAWYVQYGQKQYWLLEQKNDEVFLVEGEENLIRWIYSLESIDEETITSPQDIYSKLPDGWIALEEEIQKAILSYHQPKNPDGYIHAVSYAYVSGLSASATPLAAQGGFLNEFTLCIVAQHETYTADEIPKQVTKSTSPAVVRLRMDDKGTYTLLEYIENGDPDVIKKKLPFEIDEKLLDPWYYQKTLDEKCELMAIEIHGDMQTAMH